MKLIISLLACAVFAYAGIVADVRASLQKNNFPEAEALISRYRAEKGVTPEMIAAYSWLGRAALAAKNFDQAEKYAGTTKKLAVEQLKKAKLESNPNADLPIALGAAIEVHGQSLAARGQRAEATEYLQQELAAYRNTAIRTRIQKNLNLVSLEGKPAPALEMKTFLGPKAPPLSALKGKPVLLFFWAHWCGDCKREVEIVAQLRRQYAAKGLVVIGPTQHYGYAEAGRDVGPEEELAYIEKIRKQFYGSLLDMPAPVSEENFRNYGASTTPTLVLIDRKGIVNLFHPGNLSLDELQARIDRL
ncbi:MAG: TlpA disulfide reductase family protein [Bryobacteraceae bacterium]